MRRFFVEAEFLRQRSGKISGELFRHISTVLRLKTGESLCLSDGCGHEAVALITAVDKEGASVSLEPFYSVPTDKETLAITLCQGLPKGEKMDLILQKSTELGIKRVVPFNAERSVARLDSDRLGKRLPRWERIVQEAARQSGRSSIPSVGFYEDLRELLKLEEGSLKLLLWEGEKEQGLREVIKRTDKPASVAIIIGPEGGLTSAEAKNAAAAGYIPVTLGSRILRTETAGLAAVSILQYTWGDLG